MEKHHTKAGNILQKDNDSDAFEQNFGDNNVHQRTVDALMLMDGRRLHRAGKSVHIGRTRPHGRSK